MWVWKFRDQTISEQSYYVTNSFKQGVKTIIMFIAYIIIGIILHGIKRN